MGDVRWVKVYTNMVSNKKIKRIRTLPEGNNIVLIWVFLIAQAGESNKNGALYLTDTMPFTVEDLAIEFDFEPSVIKLALITLEKFSMIEVFDEVIYIKNWAEYQNIDGLDKIREQTRIRVANHRQKQKQLASGNGECNATVTQGNAIELDIELDKDKDNKSSSPKNKFSDDAIELILAKELFLQIRKNNPNSKEPNIQKWAKTIDLMIRIDNRSIVDIREVMEWCQKDSFWMSNILSADKLRSKFDQLVLKMGKAKNQPNSTLVNRTWNTQIVDNYDKNKEMLARQREEFRLKREGKSE